jgi:ketosteroid isomerase-like protein
MSEASMQEQERLVREGLRAVSEGDLEAIVAMTGPEAEYELVGGFADFAAQPVLKGPEDIRRFYTDWFAPPGNNPAAATFTPDGDKIGRRDRARSSVGGDVS